MKMPKRESRHLENRQFHGEREGKIVAAFLNQGNGERILSLLELLKHLFAAGTYRDGVLTPRPAEIDKFGDMAETFNRLCAKRYQGGSPAFLPGRGPSAASPGSNLFVWRFTEAFFTTDSEADLENVAAHCLIDLARMQLLNSLGQCKLCSQWFFGRFAHQQFCRTECRVKFNATTPEAKAYKARKARSYYRLHKQGKVRDARRRKTK